MDFNESYHISNLITAQCFGSYENLTFNTSRIIMTSVSSQEPQLYVYHGIAREKNNDFASRASG